MTVVQSKATQTRVIFLNAGAHLPSVVIRLHKGILLFFIRLIATLILLLALYVNGNSK